MVVDQDTWELNVAHEGRHYCQVRLPSHMTPDEAKTRAGAIRFALQESLGVGISCRLTRWELRGHTLEF
jgi:hypothetical protein